MESAALSRPAPSRLILAIVAGAAVALALGVYGNVHDPSQELVFTLFFSETISMKVWLATAALAFALFQVLSAVWIYGKWPTPYAPGWMPSAHRISGRLAFVCSLPVAYHCLWSLGFQDTDTRVLVHSLAGCALYGAFAAKVLIVRAKGLPGAALPIAGGVMFSTLVLVWYSSALWFIREQGGFPDI